TATRPTAYDGTTLNADSTTSSPKRTMLVETKRRPLFPAFRSAPTARSLRNHRRSTRSRPSKQGSTFKHLTWQRRFATTWRSGALRLPQVSIRASPSPLLGSRSNLQGPTRRHGNPRCAAKISMPCSGRLPRTRVARKLRRRYRGHTTAYFLYHL